MPGSTPCTLEGYGLPKYRGLVTGQSGSGEGNPKSSQDDEALRCANILHAKEQTIRAVLKDLDEAVRTADLLEEKQGTGDTPGGGTVTIAADLYSVVRTCRNTVRQISGYLHEKGWSTDDKMRIEKAFGDLAVVWTTYKRVIDQLDYARWGGTPSPIRSGRPWRILGAGTSVP